jgi:S-adenosylhomocysteine hydrolase
MLDVSVEFRLVAEGQAVLIDGHGHPVLVLDVDDVACLQAAARHPDGDGSSAG